MNTELSVTFSWNPNIGAIVDDALAKGLNRAGVHLQGKMRTNFGTEGGGVAGKLAYKYRWATFDSGGDWIRRKGGRRKRFRSDRNRYVPAPPGAFPGVRTGRLRQSIGIIRATPENKVVTIGTNFAYGRYLEYGTRKMPARPWIRRTFNEELAKAKDILRSTAQEIITARLGGK